MDSINLRILVNLSGGTGEQLRKTVATMNGRYPDRFVVFANMSYDDFQHSGIVARSNPARAGREERRSGAENFQGLWNGAEVLERQRVHVDDPEFDPVFEKCAELKIPVLIHVAEPSAFFDPWDYSNERWLEKILLPKSWERSRR